MAGEPTFNPIQPPSYPYSDARRPRVLTTEYGDGYIERAADGINIQARSLSLTWENLFKNESDDVFDFLVERAGHKAFLWVPVDDAAPRKFICPEYRKNKTTATTYTVTATFQEVFDN